MENTRKILFCSCGAELLVLEKFTEQTEAGSITTTEDELFISLFKLASYGEPYSLWRRISYAWHILWTGKPYYDEVILEKKEVSKLIDWLNKEFSGDDSREKLYRMSERILDRNRKRYGVIEDK